jgi:hypothetical protein
VCAYVQVLLMPGANSGMSVACCACAAAADDARWWWLACGGCGGGSGGSSSQRGCAAGVSRRVGSSFVSA